ncbi:MAG: DUF21 domain-containing protein, partial [Armatimonadetes bacterium]|nr:DUF21 domain-containing protein [Armatimonadota bacterium]
MLVDPWICGLAGAAAGFLGLMAYLSALETAVLSARRSRLAQAGPEKRAAAADAFLNSPEGFQGSSLLAKSLCEAGAYGAALLLGLGLPGNPAEAVRPSEWVARNWGGGVAGLAVSYFVVVLVGQTLPKSMATRNPERILLGSLAFLQVFTLLWKPLLWVTRSLGRTLAQSTGTEPALTARAAHSEEEIKLLVEGSAEEGVLEEEEKEMIHSVIEFTDTVARQVMVPRTDVDCIRADATVDEAVRLVLDTGHSRIPVYEGTLDHVVGVLHVKD